MIYDAERMNCKRVFLKLFPLDIVNHIFEYHITYKDILNVILKKEIQLPQPELFYFNNWTGPVLLFAYVMDGSTIVCNITESIQELYGKKRNWHRRAHIVEFYQEFVGNNLKLVFEGYEEDTLTMSIHTFVHINPIFMMPPSLQHCLAVGDISIFTPSPLFTGHFTDKAYANILCELQRARHDWNEE